MTKLTKKMNFRIMNFSNFDSLLRHNFKGNQTSTINRTCVYGIFFQSYK